MEDSANELEDAKGLPVFHFIKDREAAAQLFQKLKECVILNNTQHSALQSTEALYCPLVFDGWLCWNATPAGTVAENRCPHYVTGFDPRRTAFKECDSNGSWFVHPDSGQPWSNYSTCIDFEDLEWRKTVNWVYMSGYSISLVALLISIFILAYFRALHCTRNILHINLFASFSINNLLWIVWYLFVVPVPDVVAANGVWCQILHVVTHYFMITNYFWMLCEGFYLHSLLAFAFILEEKLLKYVYLLGWLVPVLVIAVYATLRILYNDNKDCWIDSAFSAVLIIPVIVSLCINLVFLISILRVLVLKIKTSKSAVQGQNRIELIKVFRAAFVLVPLLGLHYVVILIRPGADQYWEHEHEILSAVSSSYQGLCVACLFCFLNNEVHAQIRRKWYQFRDIQNNQVFSTVTGSTYALERRVSVLPTKATRSSSTIPQQGNEVSPMLTRYPDTSSLEIKDAVLNGSTLESPNGAAPVNGIKGSILRNKKSVTLVTEQHSNNNSNVRFSGSDFVEGITMKPLIKAKTINGNDRLYVEANDIAEDYV